MSEFTWEEFESGEKYINIGVEPIVVFECDQPEVKVNKYNGRQYDFKMKYGRVLSVSSKRLMAELSKHTPLNGKTLTIMRTGEGFNTQYEVFDDGL